MISRLRGQLLYKQAPLLIIDVHGVGYEVEAPMSTFYKLGEVGEDVILLTHLVVRDDAHLLFGFATEAERKLFRTLLRVNGVGAKLALGILSGMESDTFARFIREGDSVALTRLPGVGKKTAERLVVEMRDRLDDWQPGAPVAGAAGVPLQATPDAVADSVSALIALGYKPQAASRCVHGIDSEGLSSDEIIRRALQSMIEA